MILLTVLLWFVSNDLKYRLAEVHDPKVMTFRGTLFKKFVWFGQGLGYPMRKTSAL